MGKRALSSILIMILILALLLAACNPAPDGDDPGEGTLTQAPVTTTAPDPTGEPLVTEAPDAIGEPVENGVPETGATPGPETAPASTRMAEPQAVDSPIFASALLDTVLVAGGEQLGRVSGLLLELAGGEITYVIVTGVPKSPDLETTATITPAIVPTVTVTSTGAAPVTQEPAEPGESQVPVPWPAMHLARLQAGPEEQLVLALDVDPAALASAPDLPAGVDELSTAGWDAGIRGYWANFVDLLPVPGQPTEPQPSLRISGGQLDGIDFDVESLAGEDLGEVEDFILSPAGEVQYAVIESGAFQEVGEALIPVPWTALHWNARTETFLFTGEPDFLAGAPAFTTGEFPDIAAPNWDADLAAFWADFAFAETEPGEQAEVSAAAATRLLDSAATGPRGEMLGEVEDLLLGPAGAIEYVLVANEAGLVPVPYASFDNWVGEVNWLVFGLDFDVLLDAPAFASLEEMPSPYGPDQAAWQEQVVAYWQEWVDLAAAETPEAATSEAATPEVETPASPTAFPELVSTMIGAPVLDETGAAAGEVADLALVLGETGWIDYAVANTGEAFIPVPWRLFAWSEPENALVFAGTAGRIMQAPGFVSLAGVDLSLLVQDEALREYWAGDP